MTLLLLNTAGSTTYFFLGLLLGFGVSYLLQDAMTSLIPFRGQDQEQEELSASLLRENIHILCVILISDSDEPIRLMDRTWGKRCNKLLYLRQNDAGIFKVDSDGVSISQSLMRIDNPFNYIALYSSSADWFAIVQTDTFIVMENLRLFLAQYSPMDPLVFGCSRFSNKSNSDECDDGGVFSHILSKAAIRQLAKKELLPDTNSPVCALGPRPPSKNSACFKGIKTSDARDSLGRAKFINHPRDEHLYHVYTEGSNTISDSVIAFRNVTRNQAYVLNYLLYILRPLKVTDSTNRKKVFGKT